ncbi:zinc-binding alcohol dehydrogenase family protein [Streptomyces sp. NPDC048352]|uniref:quinone oxidoreductase family protein n=1 Tax=Streptomyces sp. NPDC048352 TaxID=3154718 RepID=UPI003447903D
MTTRTLAARLTHTGRPPEVAEVELREPGAGEVVVDLHFAALNPLDTYVIQGSVAGEAPRPRVLGVEGAGMCEGRPVVVHGGGLGIVRDGTWAERVVAPREALVPVPDGVALTAAASAAVVGTTAIRVTGDLGRVDRDDRVLVLGAGGGVGLAVISLCRAAGARVWGQTAGAGKAKAIAAAGAEPVLAATAGDLAEAVAGAAAPTVVFDALGGAFTAAALELLAERGRLISYGTSAGPQSTVPMRVLYRRNLSVIGYGGVGEPPERIRSGTELALRAALDGSLVVPVHEVLPLTQVGAALRTLTNRDAAGKVLLDVRS